MLRDRSALIGPAAHRVLVTGAAGFLGGAVTRHLATRDEIDRVVGIDVERASEPSVEKVISVRRDVRVGLGDLLMEHRIDGVVHHAFVIRQSRNEGRAREVNVLATRQLAHDARAAGVRRIVYPSSTTTYGAGPGVELHAEDEPTRPPRGFTYSEHKVEAERLLRAAGDERRLAVMILRSCIVLAPGADSFITSSLSLPVLPVVAGADPEMQFLHVEDYVRAVDAALEAQASGTWNVAGTGTVRWRELARMAGGRVVPLPGRLLRGIVDATWAARLQDRSDASGLVLSEHPWLASTDKIRKDLGWRPRYSSRQAAEAWVGGLRSGG